MLDVRPACSAVGVAEAYLGDVRSKKRLTGCTRCMVFPVIILECVHALPQPVQVGSFSAISGDDKW